MQLTYFQNKNKLSLKFIILSIITLFLVFGFLYKNADASIIDNLKKSIAENNKKIEELKKQAAEYDKKLHSTTKQKNTLKNQINILENEIYHLNLNVKKTQGEIVEASLTIDLLNEEIEEKTKSIFNLKKQMAGILQLIYEKDKINLFSVMLSSKNFSQALGQKEYLNNLEREVTANLAEIKKLKISLKDNKTKQELKRASLYDLNNELSDQKKITNNKKLEKNSFLKETKNQESRYQKILSDLNKQRKNVEKEIGNLERKLKDAIDKSKLPKGKGILKWPLDKIRITQGYGMTDFAKKGTYNGNGHNGLDIAGSTGTTVHAASGGEVIGVGNNGRYAYGKWIAIKHDNGLITLYAHMSLQKVKKGQRVSAGQLIGYVGATGYVTGPHLHFTVYAPDSFTLYKSTRVSWLWIPVGAPLNPYDYL